MMEPFVVSGDIAIRLMRDDDEDYLLMSRWLSDERVLEFYEGRNNPHDLAKVRQKYGPSVRGQENAVPCILVYRGTAVGYIQYYTVEQPDVMDLGVDGTQRNYGIDLFIGLPELWDKGLGTAALKGLMEYLFVELQADQIIIDPIASNSRAIRCYEKCGFKMIKLLPGRELHEGEYPDFWLMSISREDFTGAC